MYLNRQGYTLLLAEPAERLSIYVASFQHPSCLLFVAKSKLATLYLNWIKANKLQTKIDF
jgi:hypothetical protein